MSSVSSKHIGTHFKKRANARGREPDLDNLNDRELRDIGITRSEIDYVASNRSIDPRR